METEQRIQIQAPPGLVFALAAAVERWPALLPHYRWVRVLEAHGERERLVEMAARRGWIPVWWRSLQRLDPWAGQIEFRHVAGLTSGMQVRWTIASDGQGGTLVTLWHGFWPRWPLVPDRLIALVVGGWFVAAIAGRTLGTIKTLAERQTARAAP